MIFQVFVKFSVIAASFHILNTCMSYKTTYKNVYFLNNDNSNGIGNEFNKKNRISNHFGGFYCSVFGTFRPKVVVVYATFLNSMESTVL